LAPVQAGKRQLRAAVSWADVVATALPSAALPGLVEAVLAVRLRVERGFIQALVDAQAGVRLRRVPRLSDATRQRSLDARLCPRAGF
jgi:hypothetical protein